MLRTPFTISGQENVCMTKIALLVLDQQKKSQWNYEFGNEIEQHSQQDSD